MITDTIRQRITETSDIQSAWNEMYTSRFRSYFDCVFELDKAYRSKSSPITDSDLERILTELPLTLFSVSEELNQLKLEYEVIKLENKSRKLRYRDSAIAEADEYAANSDSRITKSDLQRFVDDMVFQDSLEDEIVIRIYETVISRVENEITYSKELIMAAKKLWDSRRRAEESNPVGPVVTELPDYDPSKIGNYAIGDPNKSYIHG